IHAQIIASGYGADRFVANAVVQIYVAHGEIDQAKLEFDRIPEKNLVSWNAMIHAYTQSRRLDRAKAALDRMPWCNVISWTTMMVAYSQNFQLAEAEAMFFSMPERSLISWNAMFVAYAQHGHLAKAKAIFDATPEKTDIVSWNALIVMYAANGHGPEAEEFFRELNLEGVTPDDITFTGILVAATHTGSVRRGVEKFQMMVADFGIWPSCEHFGVMLDTLGRSGEVAGAEELLRGMPFEPDLVACKSVLGACAVYRDVECAERVGEAAMALFPEDSATYVVLSNVFAAAG
ncbi:hypothetical protein SELMODRAFT_33936, partial [Selaginella moellendorffii]